MIRCRVNKETRSYWKLKLSILGRVVDKQCLFRIKKLAAIICISIPGVDFATSLMKQLETETVRNENNKHSFIEQGLLQNIQERPRFTDPW